MSERDASQFNLKAALATWRHVHARRRVFTEEDLDELEQHLRDHTTHLVAGGQSEETAFRAAVRALGDLDDGAAEYQKVRWGKLRRSRQLTKEIDWKLSMLKNYLTIAWRTLWQRKGYAVINLVGLAVGFACFALMMLYVAEELRFDRMHDGAERIYRLVEARQTPDQGVQYVASTAPAARETLVNKVTGVEAATRVFSFWRANMQHGDQRFYEGNYLFADPGFFDVFSFELLRGDASTALARPNTVVLTESAARKYFGEEDAFGQTLQTDIVLGSDGYTDFTVTGILRDPPPTSHLTFSMLIPAISLTPIEWWSEADVSWESGWATTYVKLAPEASAETVEANLLALARPRWAAEEGGVRSVALQPLTEIHFGSSHITSELNHHEGRRTHVSMFSAIALFILLIACINYMNLATARSMNRSKEVGLRKVVGAHRGQLVQQFLSESVLLASLAMVLSVGFIWALLPSFGVLAGRPPSLREAAGVLVPVCMGVVLVVGVLSGSYPALYLSRFRPVAVLRGLAGAGGPSRLRRGLVVVQYTLSIIMIVATVVVYQQMQYVQTAPLGFDEEQLVVIDINSGTARQNFQAMKAELGRSPAVRSVSASSRVPGDWKDIRQVEVRPEGAADGARRTSFFIGVDEAFLETYTIPMIAGRAFSEERPADSSAVLVNAAAARALGWDEPLEKTLVFPEEDFTARVIGVVEDFHYQSLHEDIEPLVVGHWNNPIHAIDYFTVRIDGTDVPATLEHLEAAHTRIDPETLFEYNFLDERLGDFYRQEERIGKLFGGAALLAILIASLGLLGLAAFTAERRTKEVGVRKVLGASIASLIALLSVDFLKLVGIAFLIATPLAYLAMSRWLDGFAYHIDLGPGLFLLAGALALVVALVTVSYQAIRAALSDPVKSLRYE